MWKKQLRSKVIRKKRRGEPMMAPNIDLIPVSNKYSVGQLHWQAKAKFQDGNIVVKIKILGQKLLFNSDEIFFTADGEELVSVNEFCLIYQCDKAQALANHVKSVGLMVKDKKLAPVLSSVKVVDF